MWLPLNVALHLGSFLMTPDIPKGIAHAKSRVLDLSLQFIRVHEQTVFKRAFARFVHILLYLLL